MSLENRNNLCLSTCIVAISTCHVVNACTHVLCFLYGTMRNVRGYLEGGLDEAGSGRVLVLRRGGWDVLVGEKKQRDEGGEFRLLDGHLSDFMYKSNFGN